jgi:hypothetical protein
MQEASMATFNARGILALLSAVQTLKQPSRDNASMWTKAFMEAIFV